MGHSFQFFCGKTESVWRGREKGREVVNNLWVRVCTRLGRIVLCTYMSLLGRQAYGLCFVEFIGEECVLIYGIVRNWSRDSDVES